MKFSFSDEEWAAAAAEATEAIAACAARKELLTYSELVVKIESIQLQAHDPRLAAMLDQISTTEDEAGHGMLSALVVLKGTWSPGLGFFNLAKSRGKDVSDQDAFLSSETKKVMEYWSRTARA